MDGVWDRVSRLGRAISQGNRRRRKGCWMRVIGCLAMVVALVVVLALALFAVISQASAQEVGPSDEMLAIQLVIDNSNSMFEKDGIGSDPALLRIDAARLFIEYLGVDDHRFQPSCGLIFFGTEPLLLSAPVSMASISQREALQALLAEPLRMGWTDQVKALQMAEQALGDTEGRKAIVMLTDGKPEWSDFPTAGERTTYLSEMKRVADRLAENDVTLTIVLLANETTDDDPELESLWQPVWESMTAGTPDGRLLVVRRPQDLPEAYHDIVVALTRRLSEGTIVDATLSPEGLHQSISVEPGLRRLTLATQKSNPETVITIALPNSQVVNRESPTSDIFSHAGSQFEEIWTFDYPDAGTWVVSASGEGRVTVWKDFELDQASATPYSTSTPSSTATPTTVPTSTVLSSPSPTRLQMPAPARIAQSTPVVPARTEVAAQENGSNHRWRLPAVLITLTALAIVAGRLAMLNSSKKPVVNGTLNILGDPGHPSRIPALDLYAMRRESVTLGGAKADVTLPLATSDLTLQVRNRSQGESDVIALANPEIQLNGRQLNLDQPLYDGDILLVGATRLRYDNLQRRRSRRPLTHQRQRGDVAPSISTME